MSATSQNRPETANANALLKRIGPKPRAITMWDFSWLERRWPGAGYEDIEQALDELAERGYDAVRIDAYPHLVSVDPTREWELLPCWNTQDWGSPALNRVRIQPHLDEFIAACGRRGILVALSTWYREDREGHAWRILTPEQQADQWAATLRAIDPSLHRHIMAVDLCNEWPQEDWAVFFKNVPGHVRADWSTAPSLGWIRRATARLRASYPEFPLTFSTCTVPERYLDTEMPGVDFLEPHLWLANSTDFYQRVRYGYERFSPVGYEGMVLRAEQLYRENPGYWREKLAAGVDLLARGAAARRLPLVTTECWAMVDYKDWPLLDWGWIKELTAYGTERAVASGAWAAVATSNFCGPQFRGMWRDIAWHRRLTDLIKGAPLPALGR